MVAQSDGFLESLLQQVKSLFNSGNSHNQPAPAGQPPKTENVTNAPAGPGGYKAPIHGEWHSSGGFDLSSLRPNGRRGHAGVDMRAFAGTPVFPLADGVVTNVGTDPIGGNIVNVQHANGVRSYYAHLSTASCQKGDKVTTSTQIGTVGNTGNAMHTFPHLHFQVWKDGQLQDPAKFFSVPRYTDLSAEEKKNGPWLNDQARQQAQAFSMKDHVSQNRVAFSRDVDKLTKLADAFRKLAKGR